jgi:hypothetical protein
MRTSTKRPAVTTSRRYPRFALDVDWFVESVGCSTLGRGLELSVRGALLPLTCTSRFATEARLFLSLPARERMFKAGCSAKQSERGWLLTFGEVAPDDLQLLGHTLLTTFGVAALPNLERRPATEIVL